MLSTWKTGALCTFVCTFLYFGCSKDQVVPSEPTFDLHERLTHINLRSACSPITVQPGSSGGLQQAISDICEGGIIYLAAGEHVQTEPVVVNKSVLLIGREGAILKLAAGAPHPLIPDETGVTNGNIQMEVGLRFVNAPNSLVQNIEFQPVNQYGSVALMMDHSPGSGVMFNTMNGFQFGTVIEYSDRMVIMHNNITTMDLWLNDFSYTDAHGIMVINGRSVYIAENAVAQSVFGIWGCDEWGTMENNTVSDGYVGIILCNVPANYFTIPGGTVTGSQRPGTGWKVRQNSVSNSFAENYLIIDGANQNIIVNNASSNPGTYDMELTTETFRFGSPPAPEAHDNTVIVGDHANFRVKDCGTNNSVEGAVMVDTSSDPCQ